MKNNKFILLAGLIFFISTLSAQELTIFPGFLSQKFYEDNHEITKQQFEAKMMENKKANMSWVKYKNHRALSLVGAGVAIGSMVWATANIEADNSMTGPVAGFLLGFGMELGFAISSLKHYRIALLQYNEDADPRTTFKVAPTNNGVGLVMTF